MAKIRAMEQRRLAKEKTEVKREAEREQRRILKLQKECEVSLEITVKHTMTVCLVITMQTVLIYYSNL